MRTITTTKTITIYSVNELSEAALNHAHENFLSNGDYYFWADENRASLDGFCKVFPVQHRDYDYGDRNYINSTTNVEDQIEALRGVWLRTYILNNYWGEIMKPKYLGYIKGKPRYSRVQKEISCPFTGYCMDHALIDPLEAFIKQPNNSSSLSDLLTDCLENWVQSCGKDVEGSQSLEYFKDHAQANEYEYDINGDRI